MKSSAGKAKKTQGRYITVKSYVIQVSALVDYDMSRRNGRQGMESVVAEALRRSPVLIAETLRSRRESGQESPPFRVRYKGLQTITNVTNVTHD